MALQTFANGESGLSVRTKINANFTELYGKAANVAFASDFGLVGAAIGATPPDETAAMISFVSSAIANPGVPHVLGHRAYGVSSVLPTIDKSGVQIFGSGHSTIHNVGPIFDCTTIVWLGGANAGTMLTIEPDVDPVNGQFLSGLQIAGLSFNCASGLARGVTIRSVRSSLLMLGVANATTTGVTFGVLASSSLGENESLQYNDIYLALRQVDGAGANGVPLRLQGSNTANVSLNRFRSVDIIHGNTSAVIEENADNNIWEEFRSFATGTATYSVEWQGADVEANSCRAEQFYKFTSNLPAVGRGTGTYAYPSTNNLIFGLDRDNAAPDPVFETDATGMWQDTRGFFGGSSGVGLLSIGGVFADGVTGLTNGRSRLGGTGSLHIVNNSTDHMKISNNDNSVRWAFNFDGSGNLRLLREAGTGGYLLTLAGLGDYANDATAAAGGVAIGQLYRNGSVVQVRVS